jgi:hypothetical protein
VSSHFIWSLVRQIDRIKSQQSLTESPFWGRGQELVPDLFHESFNLAIHVRLLLNLSWCDVVYEFEYTDGKCLQGELVKMTVEDKARRGGEVGSEPLQWTSFPPALHHHQHTNSPT